MAEKAFLYYRIGPRLGFRRDVWRTILVNSEHDEKCRKRRVTSQNLETMHPNAHMSPKPDAVTSREKSKPVGNAMNCQIHPG